MTIVFLLFVKLQKLFFLSGFKPLVNKITDDLKKNMHCGNKKKRARILRKISSSRTKYEDQISLVAVIGSADFYFFFPGVSIATAASHSLTEASLTQEPVTNENCNEAL